jgi:hypothetical protein
VLGIVDAARAVEAVDFLGDRVALTSTFKTALVRRSGAAGILLEISGSRG